MDCKCGCGQTVPKANRAFVSREHQFDWMAAGGARAIGALQPREARKLGGQVAGTMSRDSGRLAEMQRKSAIAAAEAAVRWRERRRDDREESAGAEGEVSKDA